MFMLVLILYNDVLMWAVLPTLWRNLLPPIFRVKE